MHSTEDKSMGLGESGDKEALDGMAECKKCERQNMIKLYMDSIAQSIHGLCSFKQGRLGMIGERRRRNDIEEIIFRWLPESSKETGEVQCITR